MSKHDDDASFDLEVFVIHLAAHLLGVSAVLRQSQRGRPFRLYWRSPILLMDAVDIQTQELLLAASEKNAVPVFMDILFEFAWTKDDNNDNDAMIQMRIGSMWMMMVKNDDNDSSTRNCSAAAQYVAAKDPFNLEALQQHFEEHMSIDVLSTQESVLAKHMAVALQQLSCANAASHSSADDNNNNSKSIHLNYTDLQQSAPLVVWTKEGANKSNIDESVLTMILLHHYSSMNSGNNNNKNAASQQQQQKTETMTDATAAGAAGQAEKNAASKR